MCGLRVMPGFGTGDIVKGSVTVDGAVGYLR